MNSQSFTSSTLIECKAMHSLTLRSNIGTLWFMSTKIPSPKQLFVCFCFLIYHNYLSCLILISNIWIKEWDHQWLLLKCRLQGRFYEYCLRYLKKQIFTSVLQSSHLRTMNIIILCLLQFTTVPCKTQLVGFLVILECQEVCKGKA